MIIWYKYAYHYNYVILLGKYKILANMKNLLQPGDVKTTREYIEILSFELNKEIMCQHFSHSLSLSIEGASIRFFKENDTKRSKKRNI